MTNKPFISKKNIIDRLKTNYGLNVINLKKLNLGADLDSETYKADTSDKKSYFVKLKKE